MRDFYTKENMQGDAFHVPDAGLYFEPAELVFETETDTGREGVIRVRHKAGKPARGYVYPSERCMRGVREQFAPAADGTGYIRWQFDARGIAPGRIVQGAFRVITPYGEYSIPYMVEISQKGELLRKKNAMQNASGMSAGAAGHTAKKGVAAKTGAGAGTGDAAAVSGQTEKGKTSEKLPESGGPVRSKEDFLHMAEKDFDRAAAFFYSSRFEEILTQAEDRTLYRGLSMQEGNLRNVEEFLIAACGKEKTIFEPVEKSLFLQTRVKAGRTEGRLAGSRAERALEAHRQRVRRSGMGGSGLRQEDTAKEEDLVYIPMQIRQTGEGFNGPVIRAEGRFLPAASFEVPMAAASVTEEQAAESSRLTLREADAQSSPSTGMQEGDANLQHKDSAQASGVEEVREDTKESAAENGKKERILTVRIPVNRAALHAGRNFGRVIVQGPFNEAAVTVEVHCPGSTVQMRRRQGKEMELLQLQMMRLYVDFRLEEELPDNWFLQADRLIDEIALRSHRDLIPRLYGVHLLILRGQYAEAQRELGRIAIRYAGSDEARNFTARFTGEQEAAYCYRQYLYARCRLEDAQLRGRVVRFLRGVYRQTGDWRTAWMLLDLSEEYAPGTASRWNFLRHQFESGCNSPVIWTEAWDMVRDNPQILLPGSSVQERWARDDFGLHVLWYAARNRVLTPRAAEVMITLAEKKKTFSGLLFRALCSAYEMWDETERMGARAKSGPSAVQSAEDSAGRTGDINTDREPDESGQKMDEVLEDTADLAAQMKAQILRAVCILLLRAQDISLRAHKWYTRAMEARVSLTGLEEYWHRSMPVEDPSYRIPAGRNAVLRTTASRAARAILVYDRFRGEQVCPVRGGVAFLSVFGDANTIFLEDEEGNRYAKSLPYALDEKQTDESPDKVPEDPYELAQWIGFGTREDVGLQSPPKTDEPASERFAKAVGGLLDSGLLTGAARTQLLLMCLSENKEEPEYLRFYLSKADPAQGGHEERAGLLAYLADAEEYEKALRWIITYGTEGVSAGLLGRISMGLPWEGGAQSALTAAGWEAFSRGDRHTGLLERLSASFTGLSSELLLLRKACAATGVSTTALDRRIMRQVLYSSAVQSEHSQIIVTAGRRLEEAYLPAVAQFADYAFSNGISMGNRMTDLIAGLIADAGNGGNGSKTSAEGADQAPSRSGQTSEKDGIADICRIACLKELSMRQGEISGRELAAAKASLSVLLSKGIIFPFYRQFPGCDDRLDLYAEETLVQYHPSEPDDGSGRNIIFHHTTSRRGEAGSYKARPMKEMYRDFYVSGFLLFYGEQMHYYITDDAAGRHVVQSGIIGQDARILDSCSGRFGLINETTRAAALREYDEALSLLTGYYRRSYLENELFRR